MRNLTFDELEAIVTEAHAYHRNVVAHVEGRQSMKDSLMAGVDIILHGFFINEDEAKEMVEKKV